MVVVLWVKRGDMLYERQMVGSRGDPLSAEKSGGMILWINDDLPGWEETVARLVYRSLSVYINMSVRLGE